MVMPELIGAVRELDQREELDPFLRSILTDVGDTPLGPAEIVDRLSKEDIDRLAFGSLSRFMELVAREKRSFPER